jgi:hypothetical protein
LTFGDLFADDGDEMFVCFKGSLLHRVGDVFDDSFLSQGIVCC